MQKSACRLAPLGARSRFFTSFFARQTNTQSDCLRMTLDIAEILAPIQTLQRRQSAIVHEMEDIQCHLQALHADIDAQLAKARQQRQNDDMDTTDLDMPAITPLHTPSSVDVHVEEATPPSPPPARTSSLTALSPDDNVRVARSKAVLMERSRVLSMIAPDEQETLALVHQACKKFNSAPVKGVRLLAECGFFANPPSSHEIASFLLTEGALLSKKAIGDYLGDACVISVS
jgi:hypothetical protein